MIINHNSGKALSAGLKLKKNISLLRLWIFKRYTVLMFIVVVLSNFI